MKEHKIKELTEEFNKLKRQDEEHYKRLLNIDKTFKEQSQHVFSNFFEEELNHPVFSKILPGLTIKDENGVINFKDKEGEGLIRIYFTGGSFRDPIPTYTDIDISFYSTTENDSKELARMVLIGKVGEKLLNSKAELIFKYNQISKEKHKRTQNLAEEYQILQNQSRQRKIKSQITEYESQLVWDSFIENGLEFSDDNLPWFDVKLSEGDFPINKIEFLEYSPTFKTCSVKVYIRRSTEGKIINRVNVNKLKEWVHHISLSYNIKS